MAENITTNCMNGELKPGDLVLSMPDDYACLVGTVLSITKIGTPEHASETENDTDGVRVNFMDTEYSDKRIREIEEMFTDLYDQPMTFGECPIDDTIMSPDTLIRITGIEDETLKAILDSREAAESLFRLFEAAPETPAAALHEPDIYDDEATALLRVRLIERLNENLSEYFDTLRQLSNVDISNWTFEVAARAGAHHYMTEIHSFHASELNYLLKFQNPLQVVADAFEAVGMDGNSDVMWEILNGEAAISGDYELMPDESKMDALREQLYDRLDENLDYMVTALQKDMAETYKPGQAIRIAQEMIDIGAAHKFLSERCNSLSAQETAYLLQSENPLARFAEQWEAVAGGVKSAEDVARDILAGISNVLDQIKDVAPVTQQSATAASERDAVPRDDLLAQIAKKHCRVETLETRKSDSLDFHEVSVWGLKAALEEAYTAGMTRQIAKTKGVVRDEVTLTPDTANETVSKQSVIDRIREAAKVPREQRGDKPVRNKSEPEH